MSRYLMAVAVGLLLVACGGGPPGSPTRQAARYATAAAVVDDVVYIVGGIWRGADGDTTVARVEAYEPGARRWTLCNPMPTARAFAAAVEFEGQIYVIGGLGPSGAGLDVVEVYDPRTDTWSTCPPIDKGLSRIAAVNHMGVSILVAGGMTSDGANAVRQRVFAGLPESPLHWGYWHMPLAPARHGLGLVDADDGTERVFAVGGYDDVGPLTDVQWFGIGTVKVRDADGKLRWPGAKSTDLGTGEVTVLDEDYQGYGWWPGPPLATARGFLGAARIERRIYAVGGRVVGGSAREVPATEVLDLDALAAGWREASPLPKDLCRFSLVEWDGRLLAFGGETDFGASINTDVLEYDPATDAWSVR